MIVSPLSSCRECSSLPLFERGAASVRQRISDRPGAMAPKRRLPLSEQGTVAAVVIAPAMIPHMEEWRMKMVAITGERRAELVDVPDPEPKDDFVVVKIHSAPMCTEYKAYRAGHEQRALGHEAAGEVLAAAQPGKVSVGDRVVVMPQLACGRCDLCLAGEHIHCTSTLGLSAQTGYQHGNGTYAQAILKPSWLLVPIPEGVSYDHAAMACCGLGPTFGSMQLMNVDAFDTVLVTGLGPVGLGGIVNGVHRGARIIAVDTNSYRRDLALALGAAVAVDPGEPDAAKRILSLAGNGGVDAAVDCSGAPSAQRMCIDATRRKGHVAFVGEGGDVPLNISRDMIRKGLTLHGVWHWNLADQSRILAVVQNRQPLLDRLITHTFPMGDAGDAFELQLTGQCGKVILHPWE